MGRYEILELDNIVRFWCNVPFEKKTRKQENRSASQGSQLYESDINGVSSLRASFTCLIIFFLYGILRSRKKKNKQFLSGGCKHLKSRLQPLIG